MTQPETPDMFQEAIEESLAEVPERREESLADWLCKNLLDLDAKKAGVVADRDTRETAIHAAADAELSAIDRRVKAIWWKHGEETRASVWMELEGKKQRYVQTPYGRLQFRKQPAKDKIIIDDEEVAIEAALKYCPEAVSTKNKLLVSVLGEFALPGTHLSHEPESTTFSYEANKATAPKETDDDASRDKARS